MRWTRTSSRWFSDPGAHTAQHAQGIHGTLFLERSAAERASVDAVRRLVALLRVRKDVVNDQQPADANVRRPALLVRLRALVRVAAVDER